MKVRPSRILLLAAALLLSGLLVWLALRGSGSGPAAADTTAGAPGQAPAPHGDPGAGDRPGRPARPQPRAADGDPRLLSAEEAARVDAAMRGFESAFKELEFRHATLRWEKELPDRTLRLYELRPPSPDELTGLRTGIHDLAVTHGLGPDGKKVFARQAQEAIAFVMVPEDQTGSLLFSIPLDRGKNIFIDRSIGHPDLDRIAAELEKSDGANAAFGRDDGEFRMVDKTEPGWRYEKFLMIAEP